MSENQWSSVFNKLYENNLEKQTLLF
jgi:hypothetical protein